MVMHSYAFVVSGGNKILNKINRLCAKQSLAYLAGEGPVVEGEPIPLRSESCVNGGNEVDEA